ncbi:MAG: DUF721 domain-containing protein [Deltaproteobacteria bacterium]|jgi:hypothetical protein|nr:DUF721 domain-containing protein [Deltaproteobacteria bacterium]
MSKDYNWIRREKTPRRRKIQSIQDALAQFLSRHKGRGNLRLVHLWENWPMVMGDQLTDVALPLGVQDRTLLIGAEDSMLMHELSFFIPEIMDRANAFMDENYFTKVRLELPRGRTPLYPPTPGGGVSETASPKTSSQRTDLRHKPENLGGLIGRFDPESSIGRAYLSYVKSFEK